MDEGRWATTALHVFEGRMKLRDYMVADQRSELLDGLACEAVGLIVGVECKLKEIGAPGMHWRMESVEHGLLRALTGKRRDALIIESDDPRLREYMVILAARALGTALHITWVLAATPRLGNDIRRAVSLGVDKESRYDIGSEMDLLDQWDLDGFIRVTRLALKKAVADLTDDEETIPIE